MKTREHVLKRAQALPQPRKLDPPGSTLLQLPKLGMHCFILGILKPCFPPWVLRSVQSVYKILGNALHSIKKGPCFHVCCAEAPKKVIHLTLKLPYTHAEWQEVLHPKESKSESLKITLRASTLSSPTVRRCSNAN